MAESEVNKLFREKQKPLTPKQKEIKKLFDKVTEVYQDRVNKNLPVDIGKISRKVMKEAGYSDSSVRCGKLMQTKTWKDLLAAIPEDLTINRLIQFVDDSDKRVAMEAIKEIHKIKDKYPANKIKVGTFADELKDVIEFEEVEYEESNNS